MTDTELKDFAEAVRQLEQAYPGEWVGIERKWKPVQGPDGAVVSRVISYVAFVGIADTHNFGHGSIATTAVQDLMGSIPDGETFRRGLVESLLERRAEIDGKLAQLDDWKLAQLEAQSV